MTQDTTPNEALESWKEWHNQLAEMLGCPFNERNVTLEAIEKLVEENHQLRAQNSQGTNDRIRNVLDEIAAERRRQDSKWGGPDNDDTYTPGIWVQLIQDYAGWSRVMAGMDSPLKYRKRMMQVAALAVAAVESHDRLIEAGAKAQASEADDH